MNYIWLKINRFYVKLGLFFYHEDIKVVGLENIPKNEAVVFAVNHRNGLIDPILIATTSRRIHFFLTRASAFKNPIVNKILRSFNMLPIYRVRDGKENMSKNTKIFETCYKVLARRETVLMFPEGNHGTQRSVRGLKNGFLQIALGFLDKYPDKEVSIIPVGLNYNDVSNIGRKVAIYYGKPIAVKPFYSGNQNETISKLKPIVRAALKTLTTHIEDNENHDLIVKVLSEKGVDFTNPIKANTLIRETSDWELPKKNQKSRSVQIEKKSFFSKLIKALFTMNTLLPVLLWRKSRKKIKDKALLSTMRFGIGLGLIPITYILQGIVLSLFTNYKYGILYFVMSSVLLLFRRNTN